MDEIAEKFPHYEKGAQKGDCESQYWLGFCYYHGLGVERDEVRAFQFIKKAAAQGSGKAAYELGYYYETGQGTKINKKKSQEWYKRSIEPLQREVNDQNDVESLGILAHAYLTGGGITKDMVHGVRLCQSAVEGGNIKAHAFLGECYYNGFGGLEKDDTKAFEWFQKAAEMGEAFAQESLGQMYIGGLGVEKDIKKGIEWFEKAASRRIGFRAKCSLANCYENGTGVEKDYKMAAQLYAQASEDGGERTAIALNNLGHLYQFGLGVEKDLEKAAELYQKAVKRGHDGIAQSNLAHLYENGLGVNQDYYRAIQWYHKAILAGNSPRAGIYIDSLVGKLKMMAYQKDRVVLKALAYCYRKGVGVNRIPEMADALLFEEQAKRGILSKKRQKRGATPTSRRKCVCCNDDTPPSSAMFVHGETGHACFCLPCAISCDHQERNSKNTGAASSHCPICRASVDKVVLMLPSSSSSPNADVISDGMEGNKNCGIMNLDGQSSSPPPSNRNNNNTSGLNICISCEKEYPAKGTNAPVIVHGNTGHVSCNFCYGCACLAKAKGQKCPCCDNPIDGVCRQYCS